MQRSLQILAVLTLVAYLPSFAVPFYIDDLAIVFSDEAVRNFDLAVLWRNYHSRFLVLSFFSLEYQFFGATPFPYHVTNLVIHLVSVIMLYFLLRRLYEASGLSSESSNRDNKVEECSILLAAGVFALHPVQIQAVTYIWQRCASLAGMFTILALFFLVSAHNKRRPNIPAHWLGIAGALAAIFCKQNTTVIPAMFFVLCLYFDKLRKPWQWKWWCWSSLGLIPVIALANNFLFPSPVLKDIAGVEGILSPLGYLATQTIVVWNYWRIGFWPIDLRFFYDFSPASFSSVYVWFATFLHTLLIGSALAAALFRSKVVRIIAAGCLMFYLGLLVESSVIPLADYAFEHRMYLAMIGMSLIVMGSFVALLTKLNRKLEIPVHLTSTMLLIPLVLLTYQRNQQWTHPQEFWRSNYALSPRHRDVQVFEAYRLIKEGQCKEAQKLAEKSVRVVQRNQSGQILLARTFICSGNYNQALALVEQIRTDHPAILNEVNRVRALAYSNSGRLEEALPFIEQFLARFPIDAQAWKNLIDIYEKLGLEEKASDARKRALSYVGEL